MSQPPSYTPVHQFVSDSANLANFPGQQLDVEFNDVKTTTDAINANLKLIQRDDGALANGIVTFDSLSASLQVAGLAPAAPWAAGIVYQVGAAVVSGNNLYRCLVMHTSGTFAVDLAAAKWVLVTSLLYGAGTGITLVGSTFALSGTPFIGVATATSLNGNVFTSGSYTLTGGVGKTFTFSNTLTLAGTDGTTITFQGTDTYVGRATTDTLTNKTFDTAGAGNSLSINGVAATANTGTGAIARAAAPTFTTPVLGAATATTINLVTITQPAVGATLTIPDGVTLTGPASSGTAMTLGNVETVTGAKTFNDGKLILAGATSGTTVLKSGGTAGSSVLTLPVATDTLVGKATTDILTNKTLDSAGTGNVLKVSGVTVSAGQYPGETSTGSATAGNVGEYIESIVVAGSATSLVTATPKTVTSITLTAGDWDVDCVGYFVYGATTSVTAQMVCLSQVTNAIDVTPGRFVQLGTAAQVPTNTVVGGYPIPPYRFSVSGSTTIFLVVQGTFTVSTMTAYGIVRARRVR